MDASDLRRAYAVLSLSPPVTEDQLKRQYKALVRLWHPDRYESDPAGHAEATERLRTINLAYELVTASLEPAESQQQDEVITPPNPTARYQERSSSWSRASVDDIVDSINRQDKLSPVPNLSVPRWTSLGAVAAYLLVTGAVLPLLGHKDAIVLIFPGAAYSSIPLYLIWKGDDGSLTGISQNIFRVAGWTLMAISAIVGLLLLITGSVTL